MYLVISVAIQRRDNVVRFAVREHIWICVRARSAAKFSSEIYARRMERIVVTIVLALDNSVGASSSLIYKRNEKNDRLQLDAGGLGFVR